MKKIMPKLLAVMLIITVIVIGTAMPVNAVSPPIGAVEMLAEGLAMEMGIGAGLEFASSSAAQSFAEGLYQAFKDDIDDLLMAASVIYTGVVGGYKLVARIGADLWADVRSWVADEYDEGPNGETGVTTLTPSDSYGLFSGEIVTLYPNGTYFRYNLVGSQLLQESNSSGTWKNPNYYSKPSGSSWGYTWDGTGFSWGWVIDGEYFRQYSMSAIEATVAQTIYNGVTGTTGIVDNPNHDLINVGTGGRDIGLDVLPVPPTEADIPISDSIGFDLTGTLYDDAVGRDYTDVQAVPVEGTNVGSLSEIEYVDTWTEAEDYQVNLTEIFPFCIPFDIISLFQAFAAEPVAPVVDYAFIVPSLGVNVPITVDLSIFDTVAAIVRTCELVAFALGLMFITYKVIKW